MAWSTLFVDVLAIAGTLIGSFLANHKNSTLIAYRLEQLEKKVQAHNNLVERMTILEMDVKNMKGAKSDEH